MSGPLRTGAEIRLLGESELDLAAIEFGGTPFCRAIGCRQKARWSCRLKMGSFSAPKLFCDIHAREFTKEHGMDHKF